MILDDMGVNYEIVPDLPNGAHGYYDYGEDKIYVKKGKQSTYLILHELVHKLRADAKLLRSHRIEEIVAVRSAYVIGKKAGLQLKVGKYELPILINQTLRLNGMEPRKLSEEEKKIVDKEIERTVQLVVYKLKLSGKSMEDIDWVKTAILILL
jgi:hypothetical protein